MGVRSWIIGGTIGALCVAGLWSGCDKADASKKAIVLKTTTRDNVPARPNPMPATRPVASTQEAVNAKPQSFMMINGVWVEFNEARLVLKREDADNRIHAFLSSNDGAEVL